MKINGYETGPFANLRGANLRGANLRGANLRGANLREADLSEADLSEADLHGADFCWASLHRADLRGASLYGASLHGASLHRADLHGASLYGADLCGARLHGASLPAPTMVLLASWGELSRKLTTDLMRYDASCHPDPSAFSRWAAGGPCPYAAVSVGRAAGFAERPNLWNPRSRLKSPYSLMVQVLREKCETDL